MDMRAEVGLLTRNIVVMGEMEDSCYPYSSHICSFFDFDTFGGHIKVWVGLAGAVRQPGAFLAASLEGTLAGEGTGAGGRTKGRDFLEGRVWRVVQWCAVRLSTPDRKIGGDHLGDGRPLPGHTAPELPASTAPAPAPLLQHFTPVVSQKNRHFSHTESCLQ